MSAWMRDNERKAAMQRRRKPGTGRTLSIPFTGLARIPFDTEPPTELHIEATGSSGEIAVWLDDFFWLDLLQHWPTRPLDIHFTASKNALLHPVLQHQLHMLRRVAPTWRLIGHCYTSELAEETTLRGAALSVYHELQVLEGNNPNTTSGNASATPDRPAMRLEDAAASLRRVQSENKRTTPIVVCRPAEKPQRATSAADMRDRTQPARSTRQSNKADHAVATAT